MLTDHEKILVAQRAAGSYAGIRRLDSIMRSNKLPSIDDKLYIDFIKIAGNGSPSKINLELYEKLQAQILALHPRPHGIPFWMRPDPVEGEIAQGVSKVKRNKCKVCNKKGHNARTCPNKSKKAIVTMNDGLPRLTPGWDPFKDVEEPPLQEEVPSRRIQPSGSEEPTSPPPGGRW